MTLARSFTEESVTDGTRTIGTIKGLNPGFRLFLERLGRVDITGTLADARRFMFDADKMVASLKAHADQYRAEHDALIERHEGGMEGHGPVVPPAVLEAARERVDAAEGLLNILKVETREDFWRSQIADLNATLPTMKAEAPHE